MSGGSFCGGWAGSAESDRLCGRGMEEADGRSFWGCLFWWGHWGRVVWAVELVSELWAWVVVDGVAGERRAPGWGCVVRVG